MPRRVNLPGADEIFGPGSQEVPIDEGADSVSPGDSGSGRPASGRVRHNEKITVYLTSDELLALEQARLYLRGETGRNIDRGRLVRAALAVAIADVDEHGNQSDVGGLLSEQ